MVTGMPEKISVYLQYLVPQHMLTVLMGRLAEIRTPWLKNWMIRRFIRKYHVDMSAAQQETPEAYPTFNSFFIRQIKPSLRPIANLKDDIACPVDGTVAQIGSINKNQLLQAKNFYFDLESLLGGDTQLAQTFYDGSFATLYLAPHNYHRIHMPLSGILEKSIYIPGKLFSVNRMTSDLIPGLYSRNERLVTLFNTEAGPMAVILVGAMIVGGIQTVWMDHAVRVNSATDISPDRTITLKTGDELGFFKLGSTVILLFAKDKITWNPRLGTDSTIQFGQLIGNIVR